MRDPSHPDYVPSRFSFIKGDNETDKRKVERFNTLKRRRERMMAPTTPENMFQGEASSSTSTGEEIQAEMNNETVSEKNFVEAGVQTEEGEGLVTQNKISNFSYEALKLKPARFHYYTGISPEKFDLLLTFLNRFLRETSKAKLSSENQLLMTIIKLRLDLQFETLSDMFCASKTTLNSMFWKWIELIATKLSFMIAWPDHEASIKTLPLAFKQYFPRLTGIIDCTEIFIHRPKGLKARAQVYSSYKKHSTAKVLIACTPLGSISFLSKAWGGRVSDVELVKKSGLIDPKLHFPGDQILADRGFTLQDEFAAVCGVQLIIPSFTRGKKQLTAKEVETTRQIASIRIHIERVIGLLKNRFQILQGPLPITMIKSINDEAEDAEYSSLDRIITACAVLVNICSSIVSKEK